MYKLIIDPFTNKECGVVEPSIGSIPFAPDNRDYQNFKTQINDQTAQLEDADGILMTYEQAIAYVSTLP
jgi:hypothetical protein